MVAWPKIKGLCRNLGNAHVRKLCKAQKSQIFKLSLKPAHSDLCDVGGNNAANAAYKRVAPETPTIQRCSDIERYFNALCQGYFLVSTFWNLIPSLLIFAQV